MKKIISSVVIALFFILIFQNDANSSLWSEIAKFFTKNTEKGVSSFVEKKAVKTTIGGDSRILARNLGNIKPGWQAHHIIPVKCKNHPALNKIGFDMDDAINGIALPGRPGLSAKYPVHHGNHADYSYAVTRDLDAIPKNLSEGETRSRVMQIISKYRKQLEEGKPLYRQDGVPNAWE